ncbi:LysM peptidoglycan-binding domain-containing protein [uncultured Serinicoccus sp.]|uniref:LysM peptidoglycan-binding domain-containing protein n=1 Tax=uncultured Serinicoccus sp. TaxID=735514 RepID=UPI00260CCE73|nr:LysM peptidoglycan-binding domain-containing protein [uncultured Serinicoccus sp.]
MSTTTPRRPRSGRTPSPGFRPRTAADHLPRPERTERSVPRGLAALLGLLVLVVGVPVGLVLLVGNPLPTAAPSLDWLTAPVTAEALINIVAVLVWLVWAHFVVCLLAEWRAVRAGRLPGMVPAGAGSQLVARRLIAGVLLLAGSATMTGQAPGQSGAPAASVVSTAQAGAAAEQGATGGVGVGEAGAREDSAPTASGAVAEARSEVASSTVTKFYEVKPPSGRHHDTLWDIADRTLGDPYRYKELYQLNQGRTQPDGRKLQEADLIQPGWQLVMPADATGPDITSVRTQAPAAAPTPAPEASQAVLDELGGRTADVTAQAAGEAGSGAVGRAADLAVPAGGGVSADTAPAGATEGGEAEQVPLGDLALGGGMVLAGLALALSTRRGAYGDPGAPEQALRLAADGGRAELLDRGLRVLAAGRRDQGLDLPDAAAVYVGDEQLVVHLAGGADHPAPPSPWQQTEEGGVWVLRSGDLEGHPVTGPAPWPALVNVARSHGFDLLVDLEYAPGLVSIGGDPQVAREVALSTVVDLVTHAWSDGARATLVGFAGSGTEALADLAPGRIHQVRSIEEALEVGRRDVEAHRSRLRGLGVDGVLAGRSAGAGPDLRPHVIVLSGSPGPQEAQQLTELLAAGRTGLAVLCVGQTLSARWRFVVDASGQLDLGVLGLSGTARRLRHGDLDRIAGWVREAAESGAEAAARTAALGPLDAVATLPAQRRPVAEAAPMWDRQSALAHVGLLGPVLVQAPGQVTPGREELLTELVTLVALHPEGVHDAVLRISLWPRGVEDDVVEATLASATQWLGTGSDGSPVLDRDDAGRWRLGPEVHVDWLELTALAGRRDTPPRELAEVLDQARGPAFSGTPGTRYGWLAFHQAARDARVVITAVARHTASALAGSGDRPAAERALRDGLTLVPQAQALWRDLLRLLGGSDPDHAAGVTREMRAALGDAALEPETVSLVQHLSPDLRELG